MTYKYSWYQSQSTVYIDFFAKNINPDSPKIVLEGNKLSVHIMEEETVLDLSHECSSFIHRLSPVKLSVELIKSVPEEWKTLELNTSGQSQANPTSSKQSKNWDEIGKIEDETGNVQDFFKKIYAQADENARRAMLKSMTESGGTVLSTNWSDVGSRTVEKRPPGSE